MLQSIFGLSSQKKNSLQQIVEEYLTGRKFHFEKTADETLFILPLSGENGTFKIYFFIDNEKGFLQIHSCCPIGIKEHQKLRIAELITRLNNNLLLGCFTLNLEEGEITFKTVHLSIENHLNLQTLNILFNTNAQTMDDYLPAISAVNSGYSEPCLAAQ